MRLLDVIVVVILTGMATLMGISAGCEGASPTGLTATGQTMPCFKMDFSSGQRDSRGIVRRMGAQRAQQAAKAPTSSSWSVPAGRDWRYIIIHHSATESGSASQFHRAHLARGWDELGYHFVIDNGKGGPDGRVEVGPRWPKQKHGAHTKTPGNLYNDRGIGICLVGNFMTHMPSSAQVRSMETLVEHLMAEYNIPASRVMGHRDANGTATQCPGRVLGGYLTSSFRPRLSPTLASR